ncbi:MAG: hypothetical protein LQ340_004265 [Diploschistes diacapsis]|nr:MAG: hypothetical protein LQ340_004265 [Diploschistes diacapsis]
MSSLPEKPNSRRSRNPVNAPFENTDLHRSAAVPETEQLPDQFRSSSFAGAAPEQYQSQNFEAFGQHSSYLQPTYTSTRPSPHSTASHVEESSRGSPFVQADLLYSGREISGSEMMSHRDMG